MSVLCYHSVCDAWNSPLAMGSDRFADQCARIASRFETVGVSKAISHIDRRGQLPRGMSVLTFDDGFRDNFDVALPTLRRYGLPATLFIVAASVDGDYAVDWVDDPPDFPLETLDRDQIQTLVAEGMTIGSHSLHHKDLTTLDFDTCVADLSESREILEEVTGGPVPYLAYPRGLWNADVAKAAQAAGYSHAFSLPVSPEPIGPFSLPRVGIYRDNGPGKFRLKTSHPYQRLRTSPWYQRALGSG